MIEGEKRGLRALMGREQGSLLSRAGIKTGSRIGNVGVHPELGRPSVCDERGEGTDYAKAGGRLVSKAGVRTRGWTLMSGVGEAFSS
jgi:hypothetical protein